MKLSYTLAFETRAQKSAHESCLIQTLKNKQWNTNPYLIKSGRCFGGEATPVERQADFK
ncbi:MAG: hypothetical protein H0V88_09945 [Pyrinomonadaceae bacterium]|nr:hypothetical protein [Pyrinomonadaceae bacterium]